jgi:hypothetical protein
MTDRQRGRQAGTQAHRQTERQTGRQKPLLARHTKYLTIPRL